MSRAQRLLFAALLAVLPVSSLAASKPNIILITLDSARADRMGFLGGKSRLTPNLDALARQSITFEHAYSQSPSTLASHAAILTGTYPAYNRVSDFGAPLAASLPYLPDLLHAAGYRTAAFVGTIALDPRDGWAPGFGRGFDIYNAGFRLPRSGEPANGSVGRSAGQVVERALAWLRLPQPSPFFLWLELNDPHASYQLPAGVRSPSVYDREIKNADTQLGKFFSALRARKLYDSALIVFAADHGESLGAHGEQTHGIFLYDETIHVPLLLKLPQGRTASARAHVRLVDVAPTLLQVAGLPIPPQMQGQSLLRAMRQAGMGEAAYARSDFPRDSFGWSRLESWRAGKYLYIRAPRPELYDLDADPSAAHNLIRESQATASTLAVQLLAFDARMTGETNSPGGQLTSSEVQKLASLGYVGLQKPAAPAATSLVGTDPKDEIALANKIEESMLLIEDGKPPAAIHLLQPLEKECSGMFLAQFAAGLARVQEGQYAAAVPSLRRAIGLRPMAAWAHYAMGQALAGTGDWKGAAAYLEIAVARLPEMAAAHSLLGDTYQHLGRAADAAREHQRAQELAAKP